MDAQHIILFDGVCNLCNGAVTFIIARDKKDVLRFAALESQVGGDLLQKYQIDPVVTDSIVFISNNKAYIKARAALHITKHLSGLWPLLGVFRILPNVVINSVYEFIARNRYKWFGKKESCMIPTPALRSKFLHN